MVRSLPGPSANFFFPTSISIAEFWTPLIGCCVYNVLHDQESHGVGRVSHLFLQIGRSFSIKLLLEYYI
jgi:hypothetical protein